MIELTAEQQQVLDKANGSLPLVLDRRTEETYRLVRSEVFENGKRVEATIPGESCPEMADGIRRSKRALRRNLPALLAIRSNRGKFIGYHLEHRIGINPDYFALLRQVIERGIPEDSYIIERIAPGAGNEEELEL